MKNTKDLLKEAIADAKAVRETALTHAKLALEEAFTPKLQSMFSAKLQETYDLDEEEDLEAILNGGKSMEENYDSNNNESDSLDEIDLDEILAELDNEINEAKGDEESEEAESAEEDEVEAVEDEETADNEEDEEEKEVKDLSMDELESIIKDIISQETTGAGEEMGDEFEDGTGLGDDINAADFGDEENLEEELDAILAELLAEEKKEIDESEKEDKNSKKLAENLKLALETVETLRSELNEVNLLNAKLLYVNKIFKARSLNESQKLKVVKAFDKAGTAKEAKLIFESFDTVFNSKAPKTQLKETLGFASKSAGVATKPLIVESNDFIARMQKLANIK